MAAPAPEVGHVDRERLGPCRRPSAPRDRESDGHEATVAVAAPMRERRPVAVRSGLTS
jgi:hypothetical protein